MGVDGEHANREVGEDKPDKAGTHFPESKVYRGVCSNHICDMSPGDDVLITGPTGAEMLLPEDQESDIIMQARRCTFRPKWPSMQMSSGSLCRSPTPTSTCAA